MKIVQVGIFVALIAVGALLFVVWRGQQQAQAPPAAPPAEQTAESTPAEPAGTAAAPAAEALPAKPSPTPAPRPAAKKAASKQSAAETAQLTPVPPAESATPARTETPAVTPAEAAPPAAAASPAGAAPATPAAPPAPRTVTIAAGTLLSVRLAETLDSGKLKAGDTFTATLDKPLIVDGFIIAERGARVEGRVLEAEQAGRVRGVSSLSIHLTRLHTSDGQVVQIPTDPFRKQAETSRGEDAKKVGIGAGIGAAIGAIAGGGKGAAIGAGIGGAAGAGTVAATRGREVVLPVETRLDFRIAAPVTITEKR